MRRYGFLFKNQPDALFIQNLFCRKKLHVLGNFFAHHRAFSTVHSALVSFMQIFDDRFRAESGWNAIHVEFYDKFWIISASGWLLKKRSGKCYSGCALGSH